MGSDPRRKHFSAPAVRVDQLEAFALNVKDCHSRSDLGLV